MSNSTETINTSNFITLLGQCIDKHGIIYPRKVQSKVIDQLYSCASATLEETISSIGAIGDLIFWSQQQEEPMPIDDQTGLLLKTLSDWLRLTMPRTWLVLLKTSTLRTRMGRLVLTIMRW